MRFEASARSSQHGVAKIFAQVSRCIRRQQTLCLRTSRRVTLEPWLAQYSITRNRGSNSRHTKWRRHHVSLAVSGLRKSGAKAADGTVSCNRHADERRRIENRPWTEAYGELREIRVARLDDRVVQAERAVRVRVE